MNGIKFLVVALTILAVSSECLWQTWAIAPTELTIYMATWTSDGCATTEL